MTTLTVGAPARTSRVWACWAYLRSDARHFQIAALATLLGVNFTVLDFGARPLNSALAILGSLATQALCSRVAGLLRLTVYHQRCDMGGNRCPPNGPSIIQQSQRWDQIVISRARIGPLAGSEATLSTSR